MIRKIDANKTSMSEETYKKEIIKWEPKKKKKRLKAKVESKMTNLICGMKRVIIL